MKPYLPPRLPIKLDYSLFARELSRASFELGKLELQKKLPNPQLLIAPLTLKEATVSSKIEGTRSTVTDVAKYEAGIVNRFSDVVEVANYRKSMLWSVDVLKSHDINIDFIKDLHNILLHGKVRGAGARGKFRSEQVYIGKEGDTISQATYIPPQPVLIQDYMENLCGFLVEKRHKDDELVRAALIHYQFEAIHPFLDGNGRIGRLIIPLYLYKRKKLFQPVLYLSGYFDRNRDKYLRTLHDVDIKGKYEKWIKFFLKAVETQAIETCKLVDQIEILMKDTEKKSSSYMSPYCHGFIQFIFARPFFRTSDLMAELKTNRSTALRMTKKFVSLEIISKIKLKNSKRHFYAFEDLLKIL